ncbi:hypothetical protein PHET_08178 [Paragonimus heterotremus]|uniref:Uncharacterized protein n=1 Tax=Paragonimus heterotremus TaxID=100268 RepID=A0A8J4WP50_9TREM|nr:hypothetical protein PHET_08178 [Paragonimus heterotremus]
MRTWRHQRDTYRQLIIKPTLSCPSVYTPQIRALLTSFNEQKLLRRTKEAYTQKCIKQLEDRIEEVSASLRTSLTELQASSGTSRPITVSQNLY